VTDIWRRSTRCDGGMCVEVRADTDDTVVQLRSSKLGDAGPVLNFTRDELDAFAAGWMDGEFE
jgi:hypothetical protein